MSTNPSPSSRRSDWMLLLPPLAAADARERRLLLVGGTAEVAARLRALSLADVVVHCTDGAWRELPPQAVDALVVLHDAPAESLSPTIQTALPLLLGKLSPSGVLYIEIDRRQPRYRRWTPNRLQSLVQRQAFHMTANYWAAPNFEGSRRFLPLTVPQILRWYFANLYVAATPLQRVVQAAGSIVGRWAGRANERIAPLIPCFGFVAVGQAPPKTTASDSPAVVARAMREGAIERDSLPKGKGTEGVALLTSGFDAGSRAVVLPFGAPASTRQMPSPAAVIKIATHAALNVNTAREQERLVSLRDKLPPALRATLPQPLGHFAWSPSGSPRLATAPAHVSVESYAPGPSLFATLRQWPRRPLVQRRTLREVTQWLVYFHQQTESQRLVWSNESIARWVDAPFLAYKETYGLLPDEQRLFDAAQSHSRTLIGRELPLVWAHYDLAPWNIHRSAQGLTVIDWEFGRQTDEQHGLPLCDLLYFALYFQISALHLDGQQAELQALRNLYHPAAASPLENAVREAVDLYEAALGLDGAFRPLLLTLLWVEQALHQAERKRLMRTEDVGKQDIAQQEAVQEISKQVVSNLGKGSAPNNSIKLMRQRSRAVVYLSSLGNDADVLFT